MAGDAHPARFVHIALHRSAPVSRNQQFWQRSLDADRPPGVSIRQISEETPPVKGSPVGAVPSSRCMRVEGITDFFGWRFHLGNQASPLANAAKHPASSIISRVTPLNGAAQHVRRMGRKTISAPEFAGRRSGGRLAASRGRRFLLTAAALSVAVHVGVALLIVLLPRVVSQDAPPREEGTVELLMVEKKGAQPSTSWSAARTPAPANATGG